MIILACIFRTDKGKCRIKNKPCDGCKDLPYFIDMDNEKENEEDEK